jgi:Protein of unknown function DUF262
MTSKPSAFQEMNDQLSTMRRTVDFDTYDMSLRELLDRLEEGVINVSPEYQRAFRWKTEDQSRFIESLYLGIPIPSLFMAVNFDGTWEVVDGAQRLSTTASYAGGPELRQRLDLPDEPLILSGLTKLSTFNKMAFDQTPPALQRAFTDKRLKVITLSDKSDLDVRFDLFERLNTGGTPLSVQEIRASVYRGPFLLFIKDLAQYSSFKSVVKLQKNRLKDGTFEELVLRFFAYLSDLDGYRPELKEYLNSFLDKTNKTPGFTNWRHLFEQTFDLLAKHLPDGIITTRNPTTPTALFEGVSVGLAMALRDHQAKDQPIKLKPGMIQNLLESDKIREYTGSGSNAKSKLLSRIDFFYKAFSPS